MAFPTITGAGSTTATKFFGDAMNRLSNMLNGVDISADAVVSINNNVTWTFGQNNILISNPAGTFNYKIQTAAITATRTLNLPLLTADDTVAVLALSQTFTNKNFNSSSVKFIDNADNTKILAFSLTGITTGNTRTLTIPDTSGTLSLLGLAQTWSATQTFGNTSATPIITNPASAPTGGSSEFVAGIKSAAGTVAFATTAQTGDVAYRRLEQLTLTNPSAGTVPNASTLEISGAPIASTNVTITNSRALWIKAGLAQFDGSITSTGGITMSSANIALAGNSLTFTNYNLFYNNTFNDGNLLALQNSGTNSRTTLMLLPSGTSNVTWLALNRGSGGNIEQMYIGSDVITAGEFAIAIAPSGAGSVRPLNFYMNAVKASSLNTDKSTSFYYPIQPQNSTGSHNQYALEFTNNGGTVVVANNAILQPFGSATPNMVLFSVSDTTSGNSVLICQNGGVVTLLSFNGTEFTTTSGTAGKTNIFVSASVITIENKTGASATYLINAFHMG